MNTNANVHTDPISYKRYHFLDFIRGFTLINMILYHGTYDLVYLYNVSIPAYESRGGYLWQQAICWTFIFLSGISFHFGKKHLKQAILLTLAGLLITIVTAILMPQFPVFMGILSFMGLACLIMIPLEPVFKKIPPLMGVLVSSLAFFFTREINQGFLGFEQLKFLKLPDFIYQFKIGFILGFPVPTFTSSDYFSLFPWFFLYLTGYFTWSFLLKNTKATSHLTFLNIRPITFIGRHTLPIYMIHQPVLLLLLEGFFFLQSYFTH